MELVMFLQMQRLYVRYIYIFYPFPPNFLPYPPPMGGVFELGKFPAFLKPFLNTHLTAIFSLMVLKFQSLPGGKLFNPKALFKRKKCITLHMDEQNNQISDTGIVQNALASVLPPNTHFYVDARKNEDGSEVFTYEDTEISEIPLHHQTLSSTGNCLTYSTSDSTTLQSAGEDCEAKLMPLCFRHIGKSDLTFINDQCGDCDDFSVTPTCNKWEKLEDYYEAGDPFKVKGAEICTDMCGPSVRKDKEYCSVSLSLQFG